MRRTQAVETARRGLHRSDEGHHRRPADDGGCVRGVRVCGRLGGAAGRPTFGVCRCGGVGAL